MESVPTVPDFTLLRRIGEGSYGDVWLGRSVTGIYRAIKIVARARFADDRPFFRELEGITRFQRAVGDQPRQLGLLHVGRDDRAGVFYYVMELADDAISGTAIDPATYVPLTLRELRARRTSLPAADCVRIGSELATALADLHQAGLVHRDVKPSNIILVGGRAKLADIGLIASTEHTVTAIGTPDYAPPEGIGSVRGDLFSLGKVLYELATGFRSGDFPRLPADLPQRPDAAALVELNEIILRACHSDPAQRYASAEALLADLRYLQAGKSVQELNHTRQQLRVLMRIGAVAGVCGILTIAILGVRNYLALRDLAAQETAYRKSAEADERLARYASDLHFAQVGLANRDIGVTRTALRRQIPKPGETDLRGIEWNAFWHESDGSAARTIGEVEGPPITAVALSRNGRTLAAIERGTPNRAVLVDLPTETRSVLAGDCYGLAGFTRDESGLIVTTGDQAVGVLDLASKVVQRQEVRGRFLDGLGDGQSVLLAHAATDDDTVFLWNTGTQSREFAWKPTSSHEGARLTAATATRDHRLVAASLFWADAPGWNGEVLLYDPRGDCEVTRITNLVAVRLRFSPDGRRLAMGTETDLYLADVANLAAPVRISAITQNTVIDFSPDGTLLASGGEDGVLTIWSAQEKTKLVALKGHELAILSILWSADGRQLITGGLNGSCRVWDPCLDERNKTVARLWPDEFGSVVFNADGSRMAASAESGGVVLIDTVSLKPERLIAGAFRPLAFVDGGRALLALSNRNVLLRCDLRDGTTIPTDLQFSDDAVAPVCATSENKRFVVFGLQAGGVHGWDLSTQRPLGILHDAGIEVLAVAVSNDGRHVAASDARGNLRMFSRGTGSEIELPTEASLVTALAFSPDGELLAAGNEKGHLVVWDVLQRRIVVAADAHSAAVKCLTFAPDQSRLLTGGADGLIVSWTTQRWRPVAAWSPVFSEPGSPQAVDLMAMDESGAWLVAVTSDGRFQRWNCRPSGPSSRRLYPLAGPLTR